MHYVTILNEAGTIQWVSGTIADVDVDEVVGRPVWTHVAPQVANEMRGILKQTLAGDDVLHSTAIMLRGRLHHFDSLWRLAAIDAGRMVVITTREIAPRFRRLSTKQIEVLRCLIECDSNEESSRRIGVSERTIESHLRNIRKIVGVDTRPGLIAFAMHHLSPL